MENRNIKVPVTKSKIYILLNCQSDKFLILIRHLLLPTSKYILPLFVKRKKKINKYLKTI